MSEANEGGKSCCGTILRTTECGKANSANGRGETDASCRADTDDTPEWSTTHVTSPKDATSSRRDPSTQISQPSSQQSDSSRGPTKKRAIPRTITRSRGGSALRWYSAGRTRIQARLSRNLRFVGNISFPPPNRPTSFLTPDPPPTNKPWKEKWMSRRVLSVGNEGGGTGCPTTREAIGEFLHAVATRVIASHHEDDPALLSAIAKAIGSFTTQPRGVDRAKLVNDLKIFQFVKKSERNNVFRHEYPRKLLVKQAHLKHCERLTNRNYAESFTPMYANLIGDLLELSQNPYSKVRRIAQPAFASAVHRFPRVTNELLQKVTGFLGSKDSKDEQVTGAAYVLHQGNVLRLVVSKRGLFCSFITNICLSFHHQKPTVQTRLNNLFGSVSTLFDDIRLSHRECLRPGEDPEFISKAGIPPLGEEAIALANAHARAATEANVACFSATVEALIRASELGGVPPRYMLIIASCLLLLCSGEECMLSEQLVGWFLRGSTSDLPSFRALCLRGLSAILTRIKPAKDLSRGSADTGAVSPTVPLRAEDNEDRHAAKVPETEEEWSRTQFQDKGWIGWSGRPMSLARASISLEGVRPQPGEIASISAAIEGAFTKPGFVQTIVGNIANSRRATSSFSESAAQLWKGLSQLLRSRVVEIVRGPLGNLVANTMEPGHQVTASEIIAGIVRGSKGWSLADQRVLWEFSGPLITKALSDCPLDSIDEWAASLRFMSFDRDPMRMHWLSDGLLAGAASQVTADERSGATSLSQAKRLKFLQQVVSEFTWRANSLDCATLDVLQGVLSHPSKQVRDRVAILMKVVFRNSWVPARNPGTGAPTSAAPPAIHGREIAFAQAVCAGDSFERCSGMGPESTELAEFQPCMNYVRTLAAFIAMSCRGGTALAGETVRFFMRILPFLFRLQDHPSQDVSKEVRACIGSIAHISVPAQLIPELTETICAVLEAPQWHSRSAALPFLEVVAYRHVFLLPPSGCLRRLLDSVVVMLSDSQLEVREQTSTTLAGILKLVDETAVEDLRARFIAQAKASKLPPRGKAGTIEANGAMTKRHGGVLGLASIVLSFPYDVPQWMPELLLQLAKFISDPLPIKATVKRTFQEFWRTHSDMWEAAFKAKFTSEQLSELTQLIVAPSYYI